MTQPYREPADIAEGIPPAPRKWKPLTTGQRISAWIVFGVLATDALIAWANWPIAPYRGQIAAICFLHVVGLVAWRVGRLV
jgi:hypothetical protein